MKLLLDENISDRLLKRLEDLYPGSEHVYTAGLGGADDELIWAYAKQRDFYIVTHEADFADRIQLYGAPPKVIWLRCGNEPTREIERILRGTLRIWPNWKPIPVYTSLNSLLKGLPCHVRKF